MFYFLEKMLLIYFVIASVAIVVYPFSIPRELRIKEDKEQKKAEKWRSIINAIIMVVALIAAIVFLVYSVFKKIMWIIIPFTILALLERTNEVGVSLSVISETISKKRIDSLSKREKDAIILLAYASLMLGLYKLPILVIKASMAITQEIVSDWVTILLLVIIVTLYSFLIGVLLTILLGVVAHLLKKVRTERISANFSSFKKRYIEFMHLIIWYEFISTRFIEWSLHKRKIVRILWLLLLFTIPLDICFRVLGFGVNIIMNICLHICIIIRMVFKLVKQLINWVESVSDRKVINVIFRIAFVVSVSLVVVINRYDSFLHKRDASTGVLEFIASAIVIPMILTWIIDYKTKSITD